MANVIDIKGKSEEFKNIPEEQITPEVEVKNDGKNRLIQIINFLKTKYDFRLNLVNLDTEYKLKEETEWKYFDDMEYVDIKVACKLDAGVIVSKENFEDALYSSMVSKRFNPFKEYLNQLPKWDGEDYIEKYLDQVVLKNEKDREFFVDGFKKWFVGLVVSLLVDKIDPFFVNQICLVFVGQQAAYKTTFLQRLLPTELESYFYSEKFIIGNKDHEKYLATKIIINFDEMKGFNKIEIESVKSMITQSKIELRLPYGHKDIRMKRRSSFCGSINNIEFLKDETGSRRWLPIEVKEIQLNDTIAVSNLYAQAIALFKNGFRYWFNRDDISLLEIYNDRFTLKTMEEEMILNTYEVPTEEDHKNKQCQHMSATTIADELCAKYQRLNLNNTVVQNIGRILGKYKFKKRKVRLGDTVADLWCVKKIYNQQTTSEDQEPELPPIF